MTSRYKPRHSINFLAILTIALGRPAMSWVKNTSAPAGYYSLEILARPTRQGKFWNFPRQVHPGTTDKEFFLAGPGPATKFISQMRLSLGVIDIKRLHSYPNLT